MDNILNSIPHLNSNRWEKTIVKAKQQVVNSLTKPRLEDYVKESFNTASRLQNRVIIGALVVVAIAAFWLSAGKQISATATLLEPVAGDSAHLSRGWSDIGVIASLALGEVGTILFSAACSWLSEDKFKVIIFRVFSIICAMFAILANITITMKYGEGSTLYGWFLTLAPPLTVIAIGLMIESLLMRSVRSRAEAQHAYDTAMKDYDYYCERPEMHPTYNRRWYEGIFDEMCYYRPAKETILALVADNEQYRAVIVLREKEYHDTWALLEASPDRPTLPPQTGDMSSLSQPQTK